MLSEVSWRSEAWVEVAEIIDGQITFMSRTELRAVFNCDLFDILNSYRHFSTGQ